MIIGIEKTLTCLAMPCGLIWLGLIALTWLAWRRKQRAMLVSLSLLLTIYTLAGNGELSKLLMGWLEREYAAVNPLDQGPFDAVVVLGGGLGVAPNGLPQLDLAGDRAALGARLYHAGCTLRLVTTGTTAPGPDGQLRDLAHETAELWRQMAVPGDCVFQIHGRNTREEMVALRQLVNEHPEWKHLGIVTSARHMPRAMRLAEKEGLSLEPLPANFRGTAIDWSPWSLIIPNGDGFLRNQHACKELLARLAGQ